MRFRKLSTPPSPTPSTWRRRSYTGREGSILLLSGYSRACCRLSLGCVTMTTTLCVQLACHGFLLHCVWYPLTSPPSSSSSLLLLLPPPPPPPFFSSNIFLQRLPPCIPLLSVSMVTGWRRPTQRAPPSSWALTLRRSGDSQTHSNSRLNGLGMRLGKSILNVTVPAILPLASLCVLLNLCWGGWGSYMWSGIGQTHPAQWMTLSNLPPTLHTHTTVCQSNGETT